MSPRWGLGVWVLSTFYKHVAPLGLKNGESPQTIDIALRWSAGIDRIAVL